MQAQRLVPWHSSTGGEQVFVFGPPYIFYSAIFYQYSQTRSAQLQSTPAQLAV